MSRPNWRATFVIFATGPTRMGLMMPASAASTAPRSEVSSHGWTTTVVAGGTSLAVTIRRSYFARGGSLLGSIGARVAISVVLVGTMSLSPARNFRSLRGFCPQLVLRSAKRDCSRFVLEAEQPLDACETFGGLPADLTTGGENSPNRGEGVAPLLGVGRQHLRDRCQRRLRVDQQHEVLLAPHVLELRQRELRPQWREPQAAHCCKYALVGDDPGHADIDRGSRRSLAHAAHGYARFEFGDALAQQLAMERVLSGPAQRRGAGSIDADRRLQQRRAVDRQEHQFDGTVAQVTPRVEGRHDLPGGALLEGE